MSTVSKVEAFSESKRIKKFRLAIAKAIPKFPNDKKTLNVLEIKSLGSLLISYVNWVYRLIPPRPRRVTIEPTLTCDPRWKALSADTKVLLERVSRGDDLAPYLSLRAFRNGFTPASSSTGAFTDKWEDKDFFLVNMGYHHLHLSQVIEAAGHAKRTDDMLFAQITRDSFNAIAFFNHSVFEPIDTIPHTMTAERDRLWSIYDQRSSIGRKPGVVYVSNPITTSGHSEFHVHLASEYARIIKLIDPKLDDLFSRSEIFSNLPHEKVKAMKLEWHLHYLDFGLLDRTTCTFHVLRYGPS